MKSELSSWPIITLKQCLMAYQSAVLGHNALQQYYQWGIYINVLSPETSIV